MRVDQRGGFGGGALIPAPDPTRTAMLGMNPAAFMAMPGMGTGKDAGVVLAGGVGLWLTRWRKWRDGFEQKIGPNCRRFWALYRLYDSGTVPGPGQAWRDRTVIPECFKIVETRLPRLVMAQFGGRDYVAVEGRDAKDESYEELVRVLMESTLDDIGRADSMGGFLKRIIDGFRYCQIMGHVWFKVWWRTEHHWLKTKQMTPEGTWQDVEALETVYEGVDLVWLGLGDLAIDLVHNGQRRWCIERVVTSLNALKTEDANYRRANNGRALYKNLTQLDSSMNSTLTLESYEEPRDTEHWPLDEAQMDAGVDPGDRAIELWLCWDNLKRTLTKIANRSVVLAEGKAPTPDGLDPYLGVAAVPVPGRAYGDSFLHWVGPLAVYQTRIARARADEVMLNIWQQFIYREGTVRNTQLFWVPGGGLAIDHPNPDRPISDHIQIFPRRPVFQEAWQEEGYRQQQAESTAGADAVSQGVEATSKSRDVTAAEINQRILQGSARYQLENLYIEVAFKRPLFGKIFDLLKQNLTSAKSVRVLNQDIVVDLRSLDRPVDFKIGGGLNEISRAEKKQQAENMVNLASNPVFGAYLKPREILLELLSSWGRKDKSQFVKTDQEVQDAMAKAAAAAQGMGQQPGGGPQGNRPGQRGPGGGPGPSREGGGNAGTPGGPAPAGPEGRGPGPGTPPGAQQTPIAAAAPTLLEEI